MWPEDEGDYLSGLYQKIKIKVFLFNLHELEAREVTARLCCVRAVKFCSCVSSLPAAGAVRHAALAFDRQSSGIGRA